MTKTYTLYAGVNGAGKSTLYNVIDVSLDEARINADEILKNRGGDWRNVNDQGAALREAILRVNAYIENGISFNQETTLAGRGIINTIRRVKDAGYCVALNYVGVESADIAVRRVNQRVKKGGHGIAEADIRRRYDRSLAALSHVIPYCDDIDIFDNSSDEDMFRRVAVYTEGDWVYIDDHCEWLMKALGL